MLPREKKRALRSVAIGALLTASYFGWSYLDLRNDDMRLRGLIQQCEANPMTGHEFKTYEDAEKALRASDAFQKAGQWQQNYALSILHDRLSCDPDLLLYEDNSSSGKLRGIQVDIVTIDRKADGKASELWSASGIVFSIFCIPAIWYLLLDRLREISAAVSGRDRP
jgi:hypothetical protein